jgi:RNA polymerase sigma factor (TIGR02999 family)
MLRAWREGDAGAGDELLARIYVELKKIAAAHLRHERQGHTLQTTALVHEAYLRLLRQRGVDWRDRAHFLGLAAAMMRRVLVDHARARAMGKRSGDGALALVTVTARRTSPAEVIDLDRALTELTALYPRQAKVVEMRYFADLEIEEIAACLDVSPATVKRDWQFARAWLSTQLESPESAPPLANP